MVSQKRLRDELRRTHKTLNKCVNNFYQYYGTLPSFTTVDTMWIAAADKITNSRVRARMRGVTCAGYLKTTGESIGTVLCLPDTLSKAVSEPDDAL